jgi:hypothetical protein
MKKLIIALIIAAFTSTSILSLEAADDKPADKKEAAPRALPLRGKVDSVDKQAKTFKINERTFTVTADTKIKKDGKEATFDDVVAGVNVTGSAKENAEKKLIVGSLNVVTAKPAPAAK